MPSVKEMAQAHLGNVQKAIADLEAQKAQLDDEINKLTAYLNEGVNVLNSNDSNEEKGE